MTNGRNKRVLELFGTLINLYLYKDKESKNLFSIKEDSAYLATYVYKSSLEILDFINTFTMENLRTSP